MKLTSKMTCFCLTVLLSLVFVASASAEPDPANLLAAQPPKCVLSEKAAICENCTERLTLVEKWVQTHCNLSDGTFQQLISNNQQPPAPAAPKTTTPTPVKKDTTGGHKRHGGKKPPKPVKVEPPKPLMVIVGDPVDVPPTASNNAANVSDDGASGSSSDQGDGSSNVASGGSGTCPYGGQKWPIGMDLNRNGKLDSAEIGPSGWLTICTQKGADGANAHVKIDEFVGKAYKGQKCMRFTSWTDRDRDGKMSDGEIDSSKESCQPKPASASVASVSGRVGEDGEGHRLNVGFGLRHNGLMPEKFLSIQPEMSLGLWIGDNATWKIQVSAGYMIERKGGDGVSSFFTEVCHRGEKSSLGICGGFGYIGWGLRNNLAASQSMVLDVSLEWSPVSIGRWEVLVRPAVMAGMNGYVSSGRHFAFGESVSVSLSTHYW